MKSTIWNEIASPAKAAFKCGYSRSHVYNLAAWGLIDAQKINGRWLIYIPSLEAYKRSKKQNISY